MLKKISFIIAVLSVSTLSVAGNFHSGGISRPRVPSLQELPDILDCLRSPEAEIRQAALRDFRECFNRVDDALEYLFQNNHLARFVRVLEEGAPNVRRAVLSFLHPMDAFVDPVTPIQIERLIAQDRFVEALLANLQHKSENIRFLAANVLHNLTRGDDEDLVVLRNRQALDAMGVHVVLIRALCDEDQAVRYAVARATTRVGRANLVPAEVATEVAAQALDFYWRQEARLSDQFHADMWLPAPADILPPLQTKIYLTSCGLAPQTVFAHRQGFWRRQDHGSEGRRSLGVLTLPQEGINRIAAFLGSLLRAGRLYAAADLARERSIAEGAAPLVVELPGVPRLPPEIVLLIIANLKRCDLFGFKKPPPRP